MPRSFAALLALFVASATTAQLPKADLPDGAIRRLGTTDYRGGGFAATRGFALSLDGTQVATLSFPHLTVWDLKTGRATSSVRLAPLSALPTAAELELKPPDSHYTDWRVWWASDGESLIVTQRGLLLRYPLPLKDEPTALPVIDAQTGISAAAHAGPGGGLFAVAKDGTVHEFRAKTRDWAAANQAAVLRNTDKFDSDAHLHIAAGKGVVAVGGADGRIRLWDVDKREPLGTIEIPAKVVALSVSQDGRWVAAGYHGAPLPAKGERLANVGVWRVSDRERVGWWLRLTPLSPIALSSDGSRLAVVEMDQEDEQRSMVVGLYDTATEKRLHALPLGARDTTAQVAFVPDGSRVVAVGTEGVIHHWDVKTGAPADTAPGHVGVVVATVALKDGRVLTGGCDGVVCLWGADGKVVRRFVGHSDTITGLVVSPDGQTLFTCAAGRDRTVRAWAFADGKESARARFHGPTPTDMGSTALAVSPDGKKLALGFMNHTRLLAADDLKEVARLTDPNAARELDGGSWSARFLADGRLVTQNLTRTVRVWDVEKKAILRSIPLKAVEYSSSSQSTHPAYSNSFAISPDGKTMAVPFYPREFDRNRLVFVGFWDLATGKEVGRVEVTFRTVLSGIAFTPDGKSVLVGDERDGRIWLVDVEGKKVVKKFDTGRHYPRSLAVFPDGQSFVSGGTDTTALVWKLDAKK